MQKHVRVTWLGMEAKSSMHVNKLLSYLCISVLSVMAVQIMLMYSV